MLTAMLIGLGVMVVLGSVSLAFTFDAEQPQERPPEALEAPKPTLVLFQPTGWTAKLDNVPLEDLVASIEDHLKQERAVAERFARDPSARTLWLD
ncbi:MAG: hypothetical protein KC503_20650 [Myxococcales bacterium]|nr:hypothetical protein [Myxococcales bacterium]